MSAAPAGVLLRLDEQERVRATGSTTPDQLARLRAHKGILAPIIAAYGEAEVVIRPATPVPAPAVVLPFVPPPATRRVPPARPRRPRPPAPPPPVNPCRRCGGPCPTSDLVGSIRLSDGGWEHLTCWLRAEAAR